MISLKTSLLLILIHVFIIVLSLHSVQSANNENNNNNIHSHTHIKNNLDSYSYIESTFTPLTALTEYSITKPQLLYRGSLSKSQAITLLQHNENSQNQQYVVHSEEHYHLLQAKELEENPVRNIKEKREYDLHAEYRLAYNNRELHLVLTKNVDLFSDNYQEFDSDFNPKQVNSAHHHCWYLGHLNGQEANTKVAISTCNHQLQATIRINGNDDNNHEHEHSDSSSSTDSEIIVIEPAGDRTDEGFTVGDHIVYSLKHLNRRQVEYSCGEHMADPNFQSHSHNKLADLHEEIAASTGNNRRLLQMATYWIELMVVNDHKQWVTWSDNTESNSVTIINTVSSLYSDGSNQLSTSNVVPNLNVQLTSQLTFGANQVDGWAQSYISGPSNGQVSSDTLLQNYVAWTGAGTNYDTRVLISGFQFDSNRVGLAYVGAMCNTMGSGSSQSAPIVSSYGQDPVTVGHTAAHEIGHTIGMYHDGYTCDKDPACTNPSCPQQGYIMAAVSIGDNWGSFTACSKANYNEWYTNPSGSSRQQRYYTQGTPCLGAKNPNTYVIGQCGNNKVEGNEACDCDVTNSTDCSYKQKNDPCCQYPTSAIIKSGDCGLVSAGSGQTIQCSLSQPCCVSSGSSCIIGNGGNLCRAAADSTCDTAEYCDGSLALGKCPVDIFPQGGSACTYGGMNGLCYAGLCRNAAQTCNAINPVGTYSACPGLTGPVNDCSLAYCSPGACTGPFTNIPQQDGSMCQSPSFQGQSAQCQSKTCVPSSYLTYSGPQSSGGGSNNPFGNLTSSQFIGIILGSCGLVIVCFFCYCCRKNCCWNANNEQYVWEQPPPASNINIQEPYNASKINGNNRNMKPMRSRAQEIEDENLELAMKASVQEQQYKSSAKGSGNSVVARSNDPNNRIDRASIVAPLNPKLSSQQPHRATLNMNNNNNFVPVPQPLPSSFHTHDLEQAAVQAAIDASMAEGQPNNNRPSIAARPSLAARPIQSSGRQSVHHPSPHHQHHHSGGGANLRMSIAPGGAGILPPGWSQHSTSNGRTYWYNSAQGLTSWTFPT